MNEDITLDSKFNPLDTILRTSGIVGFIYAVFGGFALAGGNPIWLIHPAEIVIVFGVTFCGLLSTHQANFLAYVPKALLACVIKPEPNREYCQISESGRRYAAAGGGLAVMLGIINTMSNLEDPEMVGKKVAAAMSGVVIAVLVSQGLFVYLRHTFAEKR
jgi:flagellar motor component MotA